ncbi:MAG: class I SAM-dependent methyltransferase [Lewinella sp.]
MHFTIPSDDRVGKLLRTLVAAKPGGRFLELGTGVGLSLSWMVSGMDPGATIISLDHDDRYVTFASELFASDDRVKVVCTDGGDWIERYQGPGFDLIFADTWAGKYTHLPLTLSLLRPGALYLVDDMLPQENWPDGHAAKAKKLTDTLMSRKDLNVCHLDWASGVLLGTKRPA